ncbi:type IV fimbrial assembly protein PilC [Vibrio ponticus]|nr:type IV fimbrial assembly protein PilC [Vibrio ponticus]
MYFYWHGINHRGKTCQGKILASHHSEVRRQLRLQKIHITKVYSKPVSRLRLSLEQISTQDITLLTRQLATMLATGISIMQALMLVKDNQSKVSMRALLTNLAHQIESGAPLKQAFATVGQFDELYIDLVASGEASGNLAQAFDRLASHREKAQRLKSKMSKAAIYPSILLLVALLISTLMLMVVIPQFDSMFASFGSDLPWFTQQVLALSLFIQTHGILLLLSILTTVIAVVGLHRFSPRLQLILSTVMFHLPLIGIVVRETFFVRFTATLATSFGSGIPLLQCLNNATNAHYPDYCQRALQAIYRDTSAGMPLYLAMRQTALFPEMVLQLVMIGEESGRLEEMLNRLAVYYQTEVDDRIDKLGKLLEPAIIVLLSAIVGGLVLAIYLPIFNLMNVIG